MIPLIQKLEAEGGLSHQEFVQLLKGRDEGYADILAQRAREVRRGCYGDQVFIRGLIEFSSWCKNDCLYCGLRCSNASAQRYRLTEDQILGCCRRGYGLGFRTFVLQGGEDPLYTPQRIRDLVWRIKTEFPDCAVTLSVGEHPREVYESWYEAGADRYLLRHETADAGHYSCLHPETMSLENRLRCLWDLKQIGYQVGCGFMVGSPEQTAEHLAKDLCFIRQLQPHMVGIGPFIPQKATPFGDRTAGTVELTTYLLSIIRLMLPKVLLPATTALGTVHPKGREMGIMAGANVCMPNLSPLDVRKKYAIYDDKICTGDEAAECIRCLRGRIESVGCVMDMGRGDHVTLSGKEVDRYV